MDIDKLTSPDTAFSQKTLVLVGLMGAGKTTIGRRLAVRLGRSFMDADEEVERSAGRTVSEIFEDFGEQAFRDGERKVIARLLEEDPPIVLALGGGAFVDDDTRLLIKQNAISIWLKADLDTLMERVSRRDTRPLLNTDNPRDVMKTLMRDRAQYYTQANLAVETDCNSHDVTVQSVLDALNQYAVGLEA